MFTSVEGGEQDGSHNPCQLFWRPGQRTIFSEMSGLRAAATRERQSLRNAALNSAPLPPIEAVRIGQAHLPPRSPKRAGDAAELWLTMAGRWGLLEK
jgi:hypothetical protein